MLQFLGSCPKCGKEDSVSAHNERFSDFDEWKKPRCGNCGVSWATWPNGLIAVEVEVNRHAAWLQPPDKDEVPHSRLVVSVLNTALVARFKMRVLCFATEGGIQGRVEGESIELRNGYDRIALYDDHQFDYNPVCQKLLRWYAGLLRLIFIEELVVGGKNFGRGVILKSASQPHFREEDVKILLWLALWKKTGSKGFATEVFRRLGEKSTNPFDGKYIAGLTDEDIAQIFVPPPLPR